MSVDNDLQKASQVVVPLNDESPIDVEVIYQDCASAPLLGLTDFIQSLSRCMRAPHDASGASILRRLDDGSTPARNVDVFYPSLASSHQIEHQTLDVANERPDRLVLCDACKQDNAAEVRALLDQQSWRRASDQGETIKQGIQVAAEFGACAALEVLLKYASESMKDLSCLNANSPADDAPLHIAFNFGHSSVLLALLTYGADPNVKNSEGETLAYLAARRGENAVLLLLERFGADMEGSGPNGVSPMHMAAQFGKTETIRLLHSMGLAINVKDDFGRAPVHHAIAVQCVAQMRDTFSVLIELGADINAPEHRKQLTPLHLAVQSQNLAVISELVRSGARCDAKTSAGVTPIALAQEMEGAQVMRRFIRLGVATKPSAFPQYLSGKHVDRLFPNKTPFLGVFKCPSVVKCPSKKGRRHDDAGARIDESNRQQALCADRKILSDKVELWQADVDELAESLSDGQYHELSGLALRMFNYNAKASADEHPILAAGKAGDFPAVSLIASWLASFDIGIDTQGILPRLAIRSGDLGFVKALHEADAHLFRRVEGEGGNALHLAAQDGTQEIIAFLLSTGALQKAALNAKDSNGQTPLELAIEADRADTFKMLLANGAKSSLGREYGVQPIHLAAAAGATKILESLLAGGAAKDIVNQKMSDGKTPLHVAAERGHAQAVTALLSRGANPLLWDHDRETAAIVAAREGHNGVLRALYSEGGGTPVLLQPRSTLSKETPAHMAAYFGRTETLRLLHELGVPMNGVDGGGRTLAHYAVSNERVDNASATLVVLDTLNAPLDQPDREGLRPLHIAVSLGLHTAVRTLLRYGAQVSSRSTLGYTPLDYAALYNMHRSADQLIINGGHVNKNLAEGFNTVDVAQSAGSIAFMRVLKRYFRGV